MKPLEERALTSDELLCRDAEIEPGKNGIALLSRAESARVTLATEDARTRQFLEANTLPLISFRIIFFFDR